MKNNKICVNKKTLVWIGLTIVVLLAGILLNTTIEGLNKKKMVTSSKASAPDSLLLRECGVKGKSCCAENACNDGLRCGPGSVCITATCGGESEACCGTIYTKDRCDAAEIHSCRFSSIIDDQVCGSDPNRDEKNISVPPNQTVCGNVEEWSYGRYCAKDSIMTAINPASVVRATGTGKEPYAHIMNFKAIMTPVSETYQLFIDCNNDQNYEKTLYVKAKDEKSTEYIDESSKKSILREVNSPLYIPFSCSYPLKKFGDPRFPNGNDYDFTLPASIKVNMFTRINIVRPNSSEPISYFTSNEFNEKQIRHWSNPSEYPIKP